MLSLQQSGINHKFILGIDLSWFLKSRIAVVAKNPEIDLSFEAQPEKARLAIMSKLTKDLCAELNRMQHFVDDVVFCIDDAKSKLWRSHEAILNINDYIPGTVDTSTEEAGYKGTRQYDTTINWFKVYEVYKEWYTKMSEIHGIRLLKCTAAEADDMIALAAHYANENGRNFCYMGTDKDLIQLVSNDVESNPITVYCQIKNGSKANNWQKSRVLTCSQTVANSIKKLSDKFVAQQSSIFDEFAGSMVKPPKNEYDALIKYSDYFNVEHVASFLWYKIVLGDAGDNVPELFAHLKMHGKNQAHMQVPMIYETLKQCGIETDNSKTLESNLRYMTVADLYDGEIINDFLTKAYCAFMKVDSIESNVLAWLRTRFVQSRKMMCLNLSELPIPIVFEFEQLIKDWDWQKCYADVNSLCNFDNTITALNLGATATIDRVQNGIDAKFADAFISGLIN